MTDPLHERLADELVNALTPGSHFAAAAMPSHMDVNRADLKDACLVMLQKHAEALKPTLLLSRRSTPTVEAP
jgi:hypothetical protein